MLRWLTAGESHGPALVAILEGLPAHVEVTSTDIADALAPILYTIPLQLLSYYVAVLKGTDVDQPRNLAKSVTVE